MNAIIENKNGKIYYGENVLQQLIGTMVTESYGVVGMSGKGDGILDMFTKDSIAKGINVEVNDKNEINAEIMIIAKYGVSLKTVADNIIEKVEFSLEELTGLKVNNVNVVVQNIRV